MADGFCPGDDESELSLACRLVTAATAHGSRKEGRGEQLGNNNNNYNNNNTNTNNNNNNSSSSSNSYNNNTNSIDEMDRGFPDRIPDSQFIARKRLRAETYYPAFNSNEVFCRSKFRGSSNR